MKGKGDKIITNKIILWVEDNPQDNLLSFIPETAKELGIRLIQVPGVLGLKRILDETPNHKLIRGVILDIMLHGVKNLEVFGNPEIKLQLGGDVGFRLLERVFRNPKDYKDLAMTPLLVLTVKPTVEDSDFDPEIYGDKILLVHKFDRDIDWEHLVKQWLVERANG